MLRVSSNRGEGRTTQQLCFALGFLAAGKNVTWVARTYAEAKSHCQYARQFLPDTQVALHSANLIRLHSGRHMYFTSLENSLTQGRDEWDVRIYDHDADRQANYIHTRMESAF